MSENLTNEDMAGIQAFLQERSVMLEVFRECLDLMAYLEDYWAATVNHGARSGPAVVAQGKLFTQVNKVHKGRLRKRILEARDNLDKAERNFLKAFKKGEH